MIVNCFHNLGPVEGYSTFSVLQVTRTVEVKLLLVFTYANQGPDWT